MDRETATPHLDPQWGAEYVGASQDGAVFRDRSGDLFVIEDKGNAVGRVPFAGDLRGDPVPEPEPAEDVPEPVEDEKPASKPVQKKRKG